MKLWLLEAIETHPGDLDPWNPWYDTASGFVIRASTEAEARQMAGDNGGDEVGPELNPWLDPGFSRCVELTADGEPEVIMRDFQSA